MPEFASLIALDNRHPHAAFLGALGADVALSAALAAVDFTVLDRAASTVGLNVAALDVAPLGNVTVTLHEAEDNHLRTAASHIANLLGAAAFDGVPVTARQVVIPIPAAEAVSYVAAAVLADQLDRPAHCRTCSAKVRTHKPSSGGWVCSKCSRDRVPTLGDVAASWWAEFTRRADSHEEAVRSARELTPEFRASLADTARYCRSSEGLLRIVCERHASATALHARRAARVTARTNG